MATVSDPVDPLATDLLGDEIEAKLLAPYAGEEAADRMLLPARRLHDRSNGGARRGPQHRDHPRLFRGRPALPLLVSCDAFFSPATFLASGLAWFGGVRGALALRAGRLGCSFLASAARTMSIVGPLDVGACRILDTDGFQALLGNAQRPRPFVIIAPPLSQRATDADLFQQSRADQLVHDLACCSAFEVRRQLHTAIVALRGCGQDAELRIGEFWHWDLRSGGAASL